MTKETTAIETTDDEMIETVATTGAIEMIGGMVTDSSGEIETDAMTEEIGAETMIEVTGGEMIDIPVAGTMIGEGMIAEVTTEDEMTATVNHGNLENQKKRKHLPPQPQPRTSP